MNNLVLTGTPGKFIQWWNDLRIGIRLAAGVSIILLLTLIVGLVGWLTLESQSRSQVLANQAIDLVSALRAARQDEKNYMLSGNAGHVKETLEAIDRIRQNAEALLQNLPAEEQNIMRNLLSERDNYQREFESFVELNNRKKLNLEKMVSQGRELENIAIALRDEQKKQLEKLEKLAVNSSEERQEKSKKADDANRLIKLMSQARQQEKNFLLRGDFRYADEAKNLVDKLIILARSIKIRFDDAENKALAQQVILVAKEYLDELEKVKEGRRNNLVAMKNMVKLGRLVENQTRKLREDQKQELINLEKEKTRVSGVIKLDKREKADSANRIIKLMGEARQQEKNFLLRNETSYAEVTQSLVSQMIKEARKLRESFKDKQNKSLVSEVIEAAEQYLKEFSQVVRIVETNIASEDKMASLGRRVLDLSSQLRGDQKQELQRLEKLSTLSSKQRLDKRVKADTANRIIKLMSEARQQEKNFLLRKEQAYIEMTRSLVNQATRQAQLLRERFQDKQNRELAQKIITAAETYLSEFEDVVKAESEQRKQQERMVQAAREIERLAGEIRDTTQFHANVTKETAVMVILVTLALGLIIGIAAAIILTNSIARPIRQLVDVINRLAREDDDVIVPLVANQDEIGQIARAIANFKDVILQRKEKTEAQLIQAEKMAALGDLVAGVAHEINTPIGVAVTGSTHLQDQITKLEKDFSAGVLRKSDFKGFVDNAMPTASTIQSNLERASSLIKSFKKVAVDQSSQDIRTFKLVPYIEEILISLQPKLKQTSHHVSVTGDSRREVQTVPGALSQVITNLVINSLLHGYDDDTVTGHIDIQVEFEGEIVHVIYSDDGKGMNESTLQHIYEPFFTTRRGSGGSGLGLSIIFNLVTQTLGGRIQCQSTLGGGTRFDINFPAKKDNME